jgi:hypothetical protein
MSLWFTGSLVQSGAGPQNFTIRELHNFACDAKLEDDGSFTLSLGNYAEADDEFHQDLDEARVAKERTRLLIGKHPDKL